MRARGFAGNLAAFPGKKHVTVENQSNDTVLRAITDDGAFRVVTLRSTDTVRDAVAAQQAHGENARVLGEIITGSILVRETMSPDQRVQAIVRSADSKLRWIADSHPDGGTRGLAPRTNEDPRLGHGATLEMMRTMWDGRLHRGFVQIADGGTISSALMTYMSESEQVASMIAVGCLMNGDHVKAAGGYIVQLLPEVGRGPLAIMTERLRDFENIDGLLAQTSALAEPLLDELLYGFPFTKLSESPLSFKCRCSAMRVLTSLTTLPRTEIQDMIDKHEAVDLTCDFCSQVYTIGPEQLRGLLEQS